MTALMVISIVCDGWTFDTGDCPQAYVGRPGQLASQVRETAARYGWAARGGRDRDLCPEHAVQHPTGPLPVVDIEHNGGVL